MEGAFFFLHIDLQKKLGLISRHMCTLLLNDSKNECRNIMSLRSYDSSHKYLGTLLESNYLIITNAYIDSAPHFITESNAIHLSYQNDQYTL